MLDKIYKWQLGIENWSPFYWQWVIQWSLHPTNQPSEEPRSQLTWCGLCWWCYGDDGGNGDNGDGDGDDSVGDGAMTMAIIVMILVTMILTMMRKSERVCRRSRSGCHLTARRYYNAADSHLLLLLLCTTSWMWIIITIIATAIQKMCTWWSSSWGLTDDSFTAFVTYTAKERAKIFLAHRKCILAPDKIWKREKRWKYRRHTCDEVFFEPVFFNFEAD